MTPDGEAGEPDYVLSALPPSLNFLSITGDYIEGELLTASYGYVGGHEGKSIYNWYIHEVENELGKLIPEVSGLLEYRIAKEAIGKYISFTCTPVSNDGIVGESKVCMGQECVHPGSPKLLSLQILGTCVEGSVLNVEKKYWGGEEGESIYRWFRTSSNGTRTEIIGVASASYVLSLDDIGFFVSVSCEPVRDDKTRGPTFVSEQIGPIVPETQEFNIAKIEETTLIKDVIIEILLRLPVKSLICYRCVCKSWDSLIRSRYFIDMHLKYKEINDYDSILIRSRSNILSFRSYECLNSFISPDWEIPHLTTLVDVSKCVNGLVCMNDELNVIICNPAIKETKLLPPHPYPSVNLYGVGFVIRNIGLGYDSNTNDYKVIALFHESVPCGPYDLRPKRDFKGGIYNLSSNSWRQIDQDLTDVSFVALNGVPYDGAYHWIAKNKENVYFILSFDMSTEVFWNMEISSDHNNLRGSRIYLFLTVLRDSLAFFAYNKDKFIDLWVMRDYNVKESWTKQDSIGPLTEEYHPIFLWKNEAIIFRCPFRKIVLIALDTHEMTEITSWNKVFQACYIPYKESLISIS